MFFLRSAMAVGAIVMILPAAGGQGLSEPFQFTRTFAASRMLVGDIGGICVRNPAACDTAYAGASIVAGKIETAATIVAAGLKNWVSSGNYEADSLGVSAPSPSVSPVFTGTVTPRPNAPVSPGKYGRGHLVPLPRSRPI